MMIIKIHFDGGCRPTNPGNMYGSYRILADDIEIRTHTGEFGFGTNNVAEFEALQRAMEYILDYLESFHIHPIQCELHAFTDSTVVRNRLMRRGYKPPKKYQNSSGANRMSECTAKLFPLLDKFSSFDVKWNSRNVNVALFGH